MQKRKNVLLYMHDIYKWIYKRVNSYVQKIQKASIFNCLLTAIGSVFDYLTTLQNLWQIISEE